MVSIKNLTFNYIIPDMVEACTFIPARFKSENNVINVLLHKVSVPITLSAFIFVASAPTLSTGLFAGSMSLHLLGHIIEGFTSN